MGMHNDPDICQGTCNEFKPCTPKMLKDIDHEGYALITDQ